MDENNSILCPSNRCKPGSELLGVRQDDGKINILPEALPISDSFIEKVMADPVAPEQRFRFANKCVEKGCTQWNGKGCGVIEHVVQFLDRIPESADLPACSIRPKCRWFLQRRAEACKICPYIITHITEEDVQDRA